MIRLPGRHAVDTFLARWAVLLDEDAFALSNERLKDRRPGLRRLATQPLGFRRRRFCAGSQPDALDVFFMFWT